MKTQELNAKELMEINGGGLFGGNDSSNQSGLFGSLSIDNLLSGSSASQDGDEASASQYSVGNGISLNLSRLTSSITN